EKALTASLAVPLTDRTVNVHINAAMEFACLDQRDEARLFFRNARGLAVARKSRNLEAHIDAMSASVLYIDGDLDGVRHAVDAAAALRVESAIVDGHCAAWGTLAGLALGDERLIDTWFSDSAKTMSTSQMDYFAGGYAEILTRRGRAMEAQALLHDAIQGGDIRRGIVCTLLAVARLGNENDFERARTLLVAATNATVEVLERPGLALFDAFVERRAARTASAVERAREAADGFRVHRAPLLEASALELAGDVPAALTIYRRLGAAGDVRRIGGRSASQKAPDNGKIDEGALSRREMEIAILVGQGSANLEIARRLSISHKTVEKHLTAAYQKLGFATRAQLATWIARSHERAP
ncbi:MAG: helix-turn-helix transcriptional regulator, partial [Candidatus Eremiobacteraeota bacterium]|nr:helix-turn-helix transcriptional regulator [Candidatus Eremiobacteraeota bacterium]